MIKMLLTLLWICGSAFAVTTPFTITINILNATPFTPLHTYFMSPTGHDSCNGTSTASGSSGNCAWASPNHAVVCGDVIIAAPGNYGELSVFNSAGFGTVSGCPSSSGGIDGTGGIYFATLLCAGSVGACSIVGTGSANSAGIDIAANNWAVEGWAVSYGYSTSQTGLAFMVDTSANTGVRHHIAFINNIAYNNASGFGTVNQGANGGSGYGLDYWAIVGNIAQNSAGRCDGFYDGAIDVIGTSNFDSNPGTHFFVSQNFTYNNLQPTGCNGTDGESMLVDTLDALNTLGTLVIKNNIIAGAERFGMQMFYQNITNNALPLKFYNNTLYGNNVGPASSVDGTCPFAGGGINIQSTSSTLPWIISVYNNIDQETLAACLGSPAEPIYAFVIGVQSAGNPANTTIGGAGIQNVFRGLATFCQGSFCAGPGGNCRQSSCASNQTYVTAFTGSNGLGTNTYEDPLFNNASDFVNNRYGVPNCSGFMNTVACMGWNFATQTATNPSVIYDMTPTAAGTAGKGYQPPGPCAADSDYPSWLKGIVYLHASGFVNGATITDNPDLITKPCTVQ